MPQKTAHPMSRIDARIPLSVRETIDRAAAMQGRTRTDFLIATALEKAEQVIAEQSLVRLALEDQRTLAAALLSEETEAPSAFLEKLSSEYAQRVERRWRTSRLGSQPSSRNTPYSIFLRQKTIIL